MARGKTRRGAWLIVLAAFALSATTATAARAQEQAPSDIDALLTFARENFELVPPSGDLIASNAFELLTAPITPGAIVGQSVIGGATCDHLAFRTPLVDWQIWIEQGDRPFPRKYVIATRNDPAKPQYIAMLGNWTPRPSRRAEERGPLPSPSDLTMLVGTG